MAELSPGGLEIRPARDSDLPGLIHIDSLAYDRAAREGRFAERMADGPGLSRQVLVAQAEDKLRGFLVYQQVLDLATLLDVAVHPDYQGHGMAAALMQAALAEMRAGGAVRCELEVRASNHRAIALYRAFEFVEDGVRAGYYAAKEGREDALLMSANLGGAGNERAGD